MRGTERSDDRLADSGTILGANPSIEQVFSIGMGGPDELLERKRKARALAPSRPTLPTLLTPRWQEASARLRVMTCPRRGLSRLCASALVAALASCAIDGNSVSSTSAATMHRHQVHHTIDYIEFTVTDMAAAKRFYTAAFGWKFTDYGPDYAGIQRASGEGEVGGMRLDTNVTRGGVLVVLYSDDLAASVAAVEAAGGAITTPPFSFPGGRRFHFTDPSGNELAVWAAP